MSERDDKPAQPVDPNAPTGAAASGPAQAATIDFLAPRSLAAAPTVDAAPADLSDAGRTVTLPPAAGDRTAAPSPRVAGYEIQAELGRGGMGVVYKAHQRALNRPAALKMILAGAHAGRQLLARFQIEAEAVARLQHPNIVQIYEVGEQDGLPFLSLEYVDGGPLNRRLGGRPQPPREAARLCETLARAMHFAHERGIIHRDLKPANVLMTTDGAPKITDFGLAKRLEEGHDSGHTHTGAVMGTPAYMAPEQARGDVRDIGPRSDLYSLGAVLYELLTGKPPFAGPTQADTILRVIRDEPTPPGRLRPETPRDLETICLKCLAKEPAKRYANCFELAEDLHRFQAGEPILARPVSAVERLLYWRRRNPRAAAAVAAIAALLLTVAVGSTVAAFLINNARNEAVQARADEKKAKDDAIAKEQLANEQKEIAIEQVDLALDTLDTLIVKFQQMANFHKVPGIGPLRQELLLTALEGLERVTVSKEYALAKRQKIEDAYLRMSDLSQEFGKSEEAWDYSQKRYDMVKVDLEENPNNARCRERVAMANIHLGELSVSAHRDMKKALEYYQESLRLRKQVYEMPPEELARQNMELKPILRIYPAYVALQLSESYTRVAVIYWLQGDSAKAVEPTLKSIELRKQQSAIQGACETALWFTATPMCPLGAEAVCCRTPWAAHEINDEVQQVARNEHLLGELYFRVGDVEKSRQYYAECGALRESLLRIDPRDFRLKGDLGQYYEYYGTMLARSGEPTEAMPLYDRSALLIREVTAVDDSVEYRFNLARTLYSRAMARLTLNDPAGAADDFKECLQIREDLAAKDPTNNAKQMDLMLVLPHCGQTERAAALADRLRKEHETDPEVLLYVARCYAQCAAVIAADPPSLSPRQGYEQKALAAIGDAVRAGYKDVMLLETFLELEPLHQRPEFRKLVDGVKSESASGAKP